MGCARTAYACGMVAVHGVDVSADDFVDFMVESARETATSIGFALVFFSQDAFAPAALAAAMERKLPGLAYAGCSTAGEITPQGYGDDQILAILYPRDAFTIATAMIENVSSIRMESAVGRVEALRRELEASLSPSASGAMFAMLLVDGLSRAEEAITSALYWSLDDIPLVGASSGDNMHFEKTSLILDGAVRRDCAIVILVHSRVPFQIFKTENFIPTEEKLVVTASDPDKRIVYEFNAERASGAYAAAIGIDEGSLTPMSFASHPVVVRVGGEYYCRSIQKLNEDGSLSFFCAIDNGIVLTIAQPKGMVDSTREKLREVAEQIGGIDLVLGFDCVLRKLDAQNRQSFRAISELYRAHNVIGFGTYGEQYRSMHLNQTFTGIAFGHERKAAE